MLAAAAGLVAALSPLDADFEIHDCLAPDREPLIEELDRLRSAHRAEVEESGLKRAWRLMERTLAEASADGRALVEGWIDSRDRVRVRFFCEDGLPLPLSLSPAPFIEAALTHLEGSLRRERVGLDGGDADREAAAVRLTGLVRAVRHRLDAMFDNRSPDIVSAAADLDAQLAYFDEEWIDPWRLGRSAVGTTVMFDRDPAEFYVEYPTIEDVWMVGELVLWVRQLLPKPPDMSPPEPFADLDYEPGVRKPMFADGALKYGYAHAELSSGPWVDVPVTDEVVAGSIADPRDALEVMRIQASWAAQRRVVAQDLRDERRHLRELTGQLDDEDLTPDELDHLAREAERSRRRLSRLSEDATRLMQRVQVPQASRPWVEDMLRGQAKQGEVDSLEGLDERTVRAAREAEAIVVAAVERGASVPGQGGRPGSPGGGTARAAPGPSGDAAAEASAAESSDQAGGDDLGPRSQALVYDGLLPPVDPAWSSDAIARVVGAHPELDEVDANLLLGLVLAALDTGDHAAVEALVRDALEREGRLRLRGGEAGLSELIGQPVEVRFVLELGGV